MARRDDLEQLNLPAGAAGGTIRYFRGAAHGVSLSLLNVEIMPGNGAPLHTHQYDELFVIVSGRGRYTVGDESAEAGAGDVVVVRSGLPHSFVAIGDEPLNQTSVHGASAFEQDILSSGNH
ncbi:MAG: cupin domain-containing protein [Dehalococcoidia bacterium]